VTKQNPLDIRDFPKGVRDCAPEVGGDPAGYVAILRRRSFLVTLLIAGTTTIASGQVTLRGVVVDSASMQPLSDVNISIKTTGPGTVSDIRGAYELNAGERDTIVFSRVGYLTRSLTARSVNQMIIIFLKEENKMLETIEIHDRQVPTWLPKLPPPNPWTNNTASKNFIETPGFQGLQTFGPGHVFKGVFSHLPKEEKERKKLEKIRQDNYRARDYVILVNDPEVKGRIMKDYSLSEDEYYRILAIFNEKNKEVIYSLEGNEVIALLLQFYSENAGKIQR
jgi:hypothetical protein